MKTKITLKTYERSSWLSTWNNKIWLVEMLSSILHLASWLSWWNASTHILVLFFEYPSCVTRVLYNTWQNACMWWYNLNEEGTAPLSLDCLSYLFLLPSALVHLFPSTSNGPRQLLSQWHCFNNELWVPYLFLPLFHYHRFL